MLRVHRPPGPRIRASHISHYLVITCRPPRDHPVPPTRDRGAFCRAALVRARFRSAARGVATQTADGGVAPRRGPPAGCGVRRRGSARARARSGLRGRSRPARRPTTANPLYYRVPRSRTSWSNSCTHALHRQIHRNNGSFSTVYVQQTRALTHAGSRSRLTRTPLSRPQNPSICKDAGGAHQLWPGRPRRESDRALAEADRGGRQQGGCLPQQGGCLPVGAHAFAPPSPLTPAPALPRSRRSGPDAGVRRVPTCCACSPSPSI